MPDINGDLLIQKAEGLQVNTLTLAKLYHSIYIDRIWQTNGTITLVLWESRKKCKNSKKLPNQNRADKAAPSVSYLLRTEQTENKTH